MSRRRVLDLFVAAGVAIGSLLLLRPFAVEPPIEPAAPNPFVETLTFVRMSDGTPIGDAIEIDVNTGFHAQFAVDPAKKMPEKVESDSVIAPSRWTFALVVFPRASGRDGGDSIRGACLEVPRGFRPKGEPLPMFKGPGTIPIGGTSGWAASGFSRPLRAAGPPSKRTRTYWTYVAAPKDRPGDYVYELTLYPAAAWTSRVRFKSGPPVVLRRGLLRVHATDGSGGDRSSLGAASRDGGG